MNIRNTILSVLFASLGAAVAQERGTEAKTRHLDPRPLARAAKVSLTKAIHTALELQPGTAVEAEIEGEVSGQETTVFYEVMILDTDGRAHEVVVDPQSGAGKVKDAQEPAEEVAAFRNMARKAKLSLEDMTKSAGKLVRGKARSAKLEFEDDAVEAHIAFTTETHDLTVVVEAAGGKIEEIECRANGADRGPRDEEEEGEEGKGERGEQGGKSKKSRSKKDGDGKGKREEEDEEGGSQRRPGVEAGRDARGTEPARKHNNEGKSDEDDEKEGKAKAKRGK